MTSISGATGKTHPLDFSRRTFLIIDDLPGMRKVFRDILRSCGAGARHVKTAANGSIAIRMLAAQPFDVVLCDFNLGHGQNGLQVLEEAKVKELIGPACAWIMVTAEKTAEVVTGTAEYRPDAYLVKPITEATLRQRLAKIWARKKVFTPIDQAMRHGDFTGAIRLCDELIGVNKANSQDLIRTKADLLIKAGNFEKARRLFETVLELRDYPWAKAGLARVLIQDGEVEGAKSLLEETVSEARYYLEAHDLLAEAHQALGELDAAAESLEHAARLSPNSVVRQKNLGNISLKQGRFDRAERAFRKSLHLGEHSVLKSSDAYIGLAKTCSAMDNPGEALKVLKQLNETFSDDPTRLNSLAVEGMVHHKAGSAAKAAAIAKTLEEEIGRMGRTRTDQIPLDVARLFLVTGKEERAVQLLQEQVRSNPENAALLAEVKEMFAGAAMGERGSALVETSRREGMDFMNRGVLLARDGKYEEAIASMREARQVMPSNLRVLFNSAYVLITCMQRGGVVADLFEEARDTLQQAHQLAPGQARYAELTAALDALADIGISPGIV